MDNPYIRLTREFNDGRLRAILASGQAVVFYRLAIMSKDGDWILREDAETLSHVIATLGRHGARYRYGAPLDLSWLAYGWSSHLEFQEGGEKDYAVIGELARRMEGVQLAGRPLSEAHEMMVARAAELLPYEP